MSLLKDGLVYQGGHFVSDRISRVVEAIKEYEPRLEVKWIPEGQRRNGQAAFAVIYHDSEHGEYTLFYVNSEEEFDERVLQRIIVNDQRNGKTSLSDYDAWEKTNQLIAEQKRLDALEEANDIAFHVFNSHKSRYKVNDDLVIDDSIPFNIANRDL